MHAGAPGSLVGIRFAIRREPIVPTSDTFEHGLVRSARRVSELSVVWTVVASTIALGLGLTTSSAALTAFGAIGFVDAVGSVALVHHFRHALRAEELSDRFERRAHRIVIVGLGIIGVATIVASVVRLVTGASADGSIAGAIVAAVSLVALVALSARKEWVARRVASAALLADGRLSAIGAAQAAVALGGIGATQWLDWRWADAVAALAVGTAAVTLAILAMRRRAVI
jgi:divalent metal cation (Fe/Co/Zn/Cd) transporter